MTSQSLERIPLILASASPRRQELIRTFDLPVEVLPSHADETTPDDWEPRRIVEELSRRKAIASAGLTNRKDAIVVGSDTIVVLDGRVLGKPADEEEAVRMLRSLQGRMHDVYTGIACIRLSDGTERIAHSHTKVKMKALGEEQIRRYVASGEPMDKAGAYGIQGRGSAFVEHLDGDFFAVMGLSVSVLSELLRELGADVL